MVTIPYIRIPQINIGGIPSTSNIYPAQERGNEVSTTPPPITYLTQWKIVGNSEVHGNEIWSCGEYNSIDGKYHILVQPLGGSIADIALDEPLRKVNDVADTIEFPSDTDGKALVTRALKSIVEALHTSSLDSSGKIANIIKLDDCYSDTNSQVSQNIISNLAITLGLAEVRRYNDIAMSLYDRVVFIRNGKIPQTVEDYNTYFATLGEVEFIYQLATPTTELVDAPQIAEADSYSCVISQGAKAVEWSSFETEVIP